MLTKDFDFYLPENLIAQYPHEKRGEDRLLVLEKKSGKLTDARFSDLPDFIPQNTLMIFNNSKVRKARIFGKPSELPNLPEKEFLLINPVDDGKIWEVMMKKAKRRKTGEQFIFADGVTAELTGVQTGEENLLCLKFNQKIDDNWLDVYGHIPLPPYIKREDTKNDSERYQTVYAEVCGSIAAPTAGLHFTKELLQKITEKGIETAEVTLHVGQGTFLPVRTEHIEEHKMHTESFSICEKTACAVKKAHSLNQPILAVGTTSIRTLESAWDNEQASVKSGLGTTSIFIYPPYDFKAADMLLTNFHTPESSLVMLTAAFAGKENIFNAYKHAIEKQYRFFSYGDAMLIV